MQDDAGSKQQLLPISKAQTVNSNLPSLNSRTSLSPQYDHYGAAGTEAHVTTNRKGIPTVDSVDSDLVDDSDDTCLLPFDRSSDKEASHKDMPLFHIVAILSTAFSYGCILTTLFLITLPIECERIHRSHDTVPKSVILGIFVSIAGVTQLVSPLIGRASDTFEPPLIVERRSTTQPQYAELGQRLPYYMLGATLSGTGLLCQVFTSYAALWIRYGFAFFFSMVGLNIQYAMMLALIPDQVPGSQTGVANGILALLLVTGSVFGFALFHLFFTQDEIGSMYGLYASIVILSSILTGSYAHDCDAKLAAQRVQRMSIRKIMHASAQCDTSMTEDDVYPITMDAPPINNWPSKARRATKRVVRKAVKKAQQIVLTPTLICTSLIKPFRRLTWSDILGCYVIDIDRHHDFFIVTVSRLFYYCGMSVQTFFLYFLHDVIHIRTNPEAAVAVLAIVGQCSAAITCYPVGTISDHWLQGERTPFVYMSCTVLAIATLSLVCATNFHQMIALCLVLGAANGAYLTAETSLAVDKLSAESEVDDDSGSAQLLGIWGVAAFLGSAMGPMIGGPLLSTFGSLAKPISDDSTANSVDSADSEDYSLAGYTVVVALSAFYFMCSALTLRCLKRHRAD